ncbi:helix-turn-helix transcriptional regulator [Bacillus sp. ISL-35]|uniref:helix-turn-helix domain-containing protein n=1 Tax=Bacillus sp. ISL-35 TaxID=2819122 RepID=UPI001BEB836F|nr:AraC family transcriptional regulator [Bacillus sp. ISL-35]MBT2679380.1 helix-turn-helix transcriptional regulator [Bacillus sp. ISL-35]MBT2703280.1 helix-turn-helix transcriptional regulator [Chryseobacterium sp. ISL-80]
MKENINEELTSEKLAEVAGYSSYHFSRIFKDVTGVSPRHYLSALRIEAGKEQLIDSASDSILKTLLNIGFQSLGTFSSKFKQFVGQSPKQFQKNAEELHRYMNSLDEFPNDLVVDVKLPAVRCKVEAPEDFKGLIFVGLFPRPIPDQAPLAGAAIRNTQREVTFYGLPPGTYYALAAAIPWSLNPRDYFLLRKNLRGKAEESIKISSETVADVFIKLRDPLPYDPPILINLPSLLFEKDSKLEEK